MPGFGQQKIQSAARLAIPQILLALMILLGLLSLPVPYAGSARPALVLMAVYYWAIYRPTLVPPVLCFAAGLLTDILSGMPLGLNALVLVIVQWIVRSQRRFLMGQTYKVLWAIFALVAVLASAATWGLYGLLAMRWPPLAPVAGSAAVSICLFPFVSLLLIYVHKLLPVASRGYP
jgi:rod shape-determining protein MreD